MTTNPLISILIAVYNTEKYLQECLESILAQTYTNWELIVLNDGSTDNSDAIIRAFIPKIPTNNEVKYLTFEHKGLPYCLNRGIEIAKGKYIARMDGDDIMLEKRLEIQTEFMENNPDIGVLGSHAIEIDENGEEFSLIRDPVEDSEIKHDLNYRCPILHPTVMMRKELLKDNLYKEIYPSSEDLDLWWRLEKVTKFRNLDIVLLKKRFHLNQITENNRKLKLSIQKQLIKRSLSKNNFNIIPQLYQLFRTSLFYTLPISKQKLWQEFRFKQRKEKYLKASEKPC